MDSQEQKDIFRTYCEVSRTGMLGSTVLRGAVFRSASHVKHFRSVALGPDVPQRTAYKAEL